MVKPWCVGAPQRCVWAKTPDFEDGLHGCDDFNPVAELMKVSRRWDSDGRTQVLGDLHRAQQE